MKRTAVCILFFIMLFSVLPVPGFAAQLLIPVGQVIGIELRDGTVTVAAFDETLGNAARDAGLRIGDEIIRIDGQEITCMEDVRNALRTCEEDAEITVIRGSRQQSVHLTPQQTVGGPKLGVYLRQGIAGIGTVTYYDPATGQFGALGHGVCDSSGALLHMKTGQVFETQVQSVKKGKSGQPGQLRGSTEGAQTLGSLSRNTPQGIFGKVEIGWKGEPLPVGDSESVHTGSAVIRASIDSGDPREYSVDILKIYPKERSDGRNLLIRVSDPALLEQTGGIVQGMSGSPILQDGYLIGAVTHVCVTSMMPKDAESVDRDQFQSPRTYLYGILFSSAPL